MDRAVNENGHSCIAMSLSSTSNGSKTSMPATCLFQANWTRKSRIFSILCLLAVDGQKHWIVLILVATRLASWQVNERAHTCTRYAHLLVYTIMIHNAQQVHPASPYLVSQGAAGEVKGGKPTCAMIAMEGPRTPGRFNANDLPHGLGEVWRSPDMRHTMAHLKFTYFATHPALETTKGQGKAIRTDTTAFGFISFQYVQSQSDFQDLAGWEELELSFWHALSNLTNEKQFLNGFQMNLNDRNTVIPIQESVCSKKLALALRPVDCPYAGSSSTLFAFTLQSCGAPFCSGKAMRNVRSAFLKSSEFFRYTMIHLHYRYIIVAVSALSVLIW